MLDSVHLNCIRNVVGVRNNYNSVSFKIDRSVCVCVCVRDYTCMLSNFIILSLALRV